MVKNMTTRVGGWESVARKAASSRMKIKLQTHTQVKSVSAKPITNTRVIRKVYKYIFY